MKKIFIYICIVITAIITVIAVDTIRAKILKRNPIISFRENLEDNDSRVMRGIIIDTYYCVKAKSKLTVVQKMKWQKYDCPVDNYVKLTDYNFSVLVKSPSTSVKTFAFSYDNRNYYYGKKENEFGVFIESKEGIVTKEYSLEHIITSDSLTLSDILSKAYTKTSENDSDIYDFHYMKVIVCDRNTLTSDVIFGDDDINIKEYCKLERGEL